MRLPVEEAPSVPDAPGDPEDSVPDDEAVESPAPGEVEPVGTVGKPVDVPLGTEGVPGVEPPPLEPEAPPLEPAVPPLEPVDDPPDEPLGSADGHPPEESPVPPVGNDEPPPVEPPLDPLEPLDPPPESPPPLDPPPLGAPPPLEPPPLGPPPLLVAQPAASTTASISKGILSFIAGSSRSLRGGEIVASEE